MKSLLIVLGGGSAQFVARVNSLPIVGQTITLKQNQIVAGNNQLAEFPLTLTSQDEPLLLDGVPTPTFGFSCKLADGW